MSNGTREELIKQIAELDSKILKETCGKCRARMRAERKVLQKQLEKLN